MPEAMPTPKLFSKKNMDKLVATIGGGTRGIGLAILEEFKRHGCDTKAFHCREEMSTLGENFYFDANQDVSIREMQSSLLKAIEKESKYKEVIIVFLTGGGNPGRNNPIPEESQSLKVTRIYTHNYHIPTGTTDLIEEKSKQIDWGKDIKLIFISSAVATHKNAEPHYCAAKSALESYFQAKFKQKSSSIKMYLYRLGMVDVKHKYLHWLSAERPDEFKQLLKKTVPSNHFSQPEEIARVIRKTVLDSNACNGIMCDLSGGNSWQ